MEPSVAGELRRLGLGLVCLANNHIMDYGPQGLLDTNQILEQHGIEHVGGGPNLRSAIREKRLRVAGEELSFVAFCCTLAPGAGATNRAPGVAMVKIEADYDLIPHWLLEEPGMPLFPSTQVEDASKKLVGRAIANAKRGAELCVCFFHWGLGLAPYSDYLAEYQRQLAHVTVDSGCDLVVGGHPHRVRWLELYKRRPILYSLGNFVFHGRSFAPFMSPYGAVVRLHLKRGKLSVVELKLIELDKYGNPQTIGEREGASIIGFLGVTRMLEKDSFEEKSGEVLLYP